MEDLSSGVNFFNILRTNFLYEHRFGSFFYVHVTREKLPKPFSYEKRSGIMLMKLTADLFGYVTEGVLLTTVSAFGFVGNLVSISSNTLMTEAL